MQEMVPPHYIDVFISPIRDNGVAQVVLVAFLLAMGLDIILGVVAAGRRGEIRSAKMREGLYHKAGELGCVAVADLVDGALLSGADLSLFGITAPVTLGMLVYLFLNEALSCLENACKLNPQLANSPVAKALHQVNGTANGSTTDAGDALDVAVSDKKSQNSSYPMQNDNEEGE